jgi:hypothetical protein
VRRAAKVFVLAVAVYTVATKGGPARLKRAREAYQREVTAGARPIEGVGTAVAAFAGLAEGGPLPPCSLYRPCTQSVHAIYVFARIPYNLD